MARAEPSAPGKQIKICQCKVWVAHGTWWPLGLGHTETRHSCWLDNSHWRRILEEQRKPWQGPLGSWHTQPGWGQKCHFGFAWLHPLLPFPLALP